MILFFLSSLYLHLYLINVESFAKEEAALEISVSTIGLTTCKQSFHRSQYFTQHEKQARVRSDVYHKLIYSNLDHRPLKTASKLVYRVWGIRCFRWFRQFQK